MLKVPAHFMSAEVTDVAVGFPVGTSPNVQTPSDIPTSCCEV